MTAALRADADVLREVATQDQAAQLQGVSTRRLTGREAHWEGPTDLVGPRFAATWVGSPEQAIEAEREKKYSEWLRKRRRGD